VQKKEKSTNENFIATLGSLYSSSAQVCFHNTAVKSTDIAIMV